MKKEFDSMAKLAIIGDSSVGKTNLLIRYINTQYQPSHISTIGIDFKLKTVDINGYKLKLQIWDTAGQQRFRTLTSTIYQGAQAVILTYAINSRHSFDNLSKWLEDVKSYGKAEIVIAIAGTKCDLQKQRAVTKQEGSLLAQKIGGIFYQTSAKNNINIEEFFTSIAKELHKKIIKNSENIKKTVGSSDKIKKKESIKDEGLQKRAQYEQSKIVLNKKQIKVGEKKKACC